MAPPSQRWRASVPQEPSTRSFWLSQPDTDLPDRSQESLPRNADYVIIGSGLSGALIAHDLKQSLPPGDANIVVLEARTVASGATGRNGGHIKAGRIHSFHHWSKEHGVDVAAKQVSLEKANYEETVRFIEEQGLAKQVDLVLLRAVDACMNQESLEQIQTCWKGLKNAGVDMSDMEFLQGLRAAETFRVPHCLAGVSYPAASLWPYKLAVAVLKKAEALGARLYTNTPVTSIDRIPTSTLWNVCTSRGNLTAKKVIHATNGYASYLLPEIIDKLVPVKGHVAAALPPKNYFDRPLETSFGFQWGPDFDYLIHRHHGERHLIYGGRDLWAGGDPAVGVGDSDDSFVYPAHVESLEQFPKNTFKDWDTEDESSTTKVWSGIMGFVVDDFPYLGHIPNKPGQFICAGYNGSGMARAFLCTKALCQLIRGEQVDSRIPTLYFDLERRWASKERASMKLKNEVADQAHL